MSAAMYEGLLKPYNTRSPINVDCPTGECDFGWNTDEPYFSSLAMCHACEDRTSDIARVSDERGVLYTTYTLSQLNVTSSSPLGAAPWNGPNKTGLYTMDIMMLTSNKTCDLEGGSTSCRLFDDDFEDMTPFAAQCSLRPCVKSYQARVRNNEYEEREIGNPVYLDRTVMKGDDDFGRQIDFSILTNHTYSNGKRTGCSPGDKAGPEIMPFRPNSNIAWHLPNPSLKSDITLGDLVDENSTIEEVSKLYPRGCVWLLENFASVGLSNSVGLLMKAAVVPLRFISLNTWSLSQVRGNLWLVNAYNHGRGNMTTVERMVHGLADSITAAMRNYPHEGEPIPKDEGEERTMRLEREELGSNTGLGLKVDTCIQVNWGYLAYPAALLVLQVIFCATMLLVRPRSIGTSGAARDAAEFSDWKSSPLALVSLGWGDSVHQRLKSVSSVRNMDKIAGKTKVMLRRGDPGDPRTPRWQLVDS